MLRVSESRNKACFDYAEREQNRRRQLGVRKSTKPCNKKNEQPCDCSFFVAGTRIELVTSGL